MLLDAVKLWSNDSLLTRPFNVFWMEQGVYYSASGDFDLFCMYCGMSV